MSIKIQSIIFLSKIVIGSFFLGVKWFLAQRTWYNFMTNFIAKIHNTSTFDLKHLRSVIAKSAQL